MSNTRKVSLSANKDSKPKKTEGRAERPSRTSLDGFRDILSVQGQDPAYAYRFVKDVDADQVDKDGKVTMRKGQRIMRFEQAGWEFVDSSSVEVGTNHVYKTENVGSIVRIPAGQNEFLYLMRIHKDWYDEDQAAKEQRILDAEQQFAGEPTEEGMYGSVSIEHK